MKSVFIIFFITTLLVYGSANVYIFIRGYQALPNLAPVKISYTVIFLFAALSFMVGMFFPRLLNIGIPYFISWIGLLWFALVLYLFMGTLLVDIVRLLNHFFNFLPSILHTHYNTVKLITASSIFVISSLILLCGYINAATPKLKHVEINLNAGSGSLEKLECLFMTDVHLGTIINQKRLSKIIEISNSVNPDIVLLGGDIVDQHINQLIERNLGAMKTQFLSKYGVFGVLGNHEYFGGYKSVVEYFEKYDVKFLRDEFVVIDDSFILAGRHDRDMPRFLNTERKSLNEFIPSDRTLPVILLDHQPIVDEAVKEKISLQLSGHTHDGQMWPMSLITDYIWKISYGHKKIEDTHFFVSCGVGTWGPPIRIGNRPEIVHITINFVD